MKVWRHKSSGNLHSKITTHLEGTGLYDLVNILTDAELEALKREYFEAGKEGMGGSEGHYCDMEDYERSKK